MIDGNTQLYGLQESPEGGAEGAPGLRQVALLQVNEGRAEAGIARLATTPDINHEFTITKHTVIFARVPNSALRQKEPSQSTTNKPTAHVVEYYHTLDCMTTHHGILVVDLDPHDARPG